MSAESPPYGSSSGGGGDGAQEDGELHRSRALAIGACKHVRGVWLGRLELGRLAARFEAPFAPDFQVRTWRRTTATFGSRHRQWIRASLR